MNLIEQRHRLSELETVIERGQQTFIEVGRALFEIRESRLYLQDFATFEDYCQKRWGWSRVRAHQLIDAAETSDELLTTVNTLPVQNERQARELAKIKDPVKRAEVWEKANEVAAEIGTAVTAKLVSEAVQEEIHTTNGNGHILVSKSKFNIWLESIMKIARDLNTSTKWLEIITTKHSIENAAAEWTDREVSFFIHEFEGLENQARSTVEICADLSAILKRSK